MAEPWASVEQAAAHLGVSTDSIYRWLADRGLPGRRIGRLWKFKLGELDTWVRAGGACEKDASKGRGGRGR